MVFTFHASRFTCLAFALSFDMNEAINGERKAPCNTTQYTSTMRTNLLNSASGLSINVFARGENDFEALVNGRVNIYRNTSLYDGKHHPSNGEAAPEWAGILKELRTVFDRYMGTPSTEQLEAAGLDLLLPYLKKRPAAMPPPETRPYECWSYDYGGRPTQHPHPQRLSTSIASERYVDSVCCLPDSVTARFSSPASRY